MTPFVIFTLGAIGTFALRTAMIIGEGRSMGVAWVQRNVSLVSPAVLGAIVASALFVSNSEMTMPNPVVCLAVGVGAYGVHRTGNVAVAMAFGLPIYWIGALAGLV
jgi:branched-subunit amino acid transport protein